MIEGSPAQIAGIEAVVNGLEAVRRYVSQQSRMGKFSPATARQTSYLLNSYVVYAVRWDAPTPDEVVEWVLVPASPDGRHRRESALRCFMRWCVARGVMDRAAVELVPTIAGSGKAPKPIPDRVLVGAMSRACPRDRDAMILGRFAGLRAGEIAAVHSDHLEHDTLYVLGKGDKERWVAIHPEVERVILRSRGFVFPSCAMSGHVQGATVTRWLGDALPSPWTAHCLRHAFATELYRATHDLVLVAKQLGHESTRTTERYVRPDDQRAARAVAALTLVA